MTTVKMTAKGNVKVTDAHGSTSKFYAVPTGGGHCYQCALHGGDGRGCVAPVQALCCAQERDVETYKHHGVSVIFVTKEKRDETTR